MAVLDKAFGPEGAPADGIVLHPRAYVTIKAIVDGEEWDSGFIPHHIALHKGSHNKATECEATIEGSVLPVPIRLIGGVFLVAYLGGVENPEDDVRSERNLRFCGYVEDIERDDEARTIKFKAQDLSVRLREHKPLVKRVVNGKTIDPTPRYSDTLEQAIRRILSVVPGFDDTAEDPVMELRQTEALTTAALSKLVSGRAKQGAVTLKPDWSAWQAIEHVCGLAARHVHVQLREIVVRTADETFRNENQVVNFLVGASNANAFPPSFHKRFVRNRKGVKVVAWDPEQREVVEAVYPSDDDMRRNFPRRRPPPPKVKTSKSKKKPAQLKEPERDVFELDPGAYTVEALQAKAKDIWLQRSTQECDGTIATPIWTEEILAMENGDRFYIKLAPDLERKIREIGDDNLAAWYLKDQFVGMTLQAAQVLLKAMKKPLKDYWYCKAPTLEWPGEKLAHVRFINLVEI